jgi:hypothetical protein
MRPLLAMAILSLLACPGLAADREEVLLAVF